MLRIHRAERADRLVDALATLVRDPLPDPFQPELVAVPNRGVERWLAQRLSLSLGTSPGRGDGVCANMTFPFPGTLVGGEVARASNIGEADDPWPPERSVWPLLDVVAGCLDEPWLAALAAHLGHGSSDPADNRQWRRFTALRHVADLFDRYGVHRPAMVRAWAAGEDRDDEGAPLPPDVAWQAELWRRLRVQLDVPSPAERLHDACIRLRDEPDLSGLPARISLFGLTRLPASYLDVLRAVAVARDVHLFLLHPSPDLWARVAAVPPTGPVPGLRRLDRTAGEPRNPLLATWGQDAREMQLVLAAGDPGLTGPADADADADATGIPDAVRSGDRIDEHHPLGDGHGSGGATLLRRLQDDVRRDRRPPGPPLPGHPDARAPLAADDRSVQVHACHGRARQVEVLRDAILHLLAEDPTLEPRDIVVMCPDIDHFAPLIHATFGVGGAGVDDDGDRDDERDGAAGAGGSAVAHPPWRPQDLHVRLADRSIRQTNPVLGVVAELLSIVPGRLAASHVVDFAGREPVRRRFRFDDDDLARIEEWIDSTGIRWGLDAAHRAPYKLDKLATGTWRAGLDRILLGVTMAEDRHHLVGGVLPLDDVDSGDIDLAGRLAEFVDRLHTAVGILSGAHPVTHWAEAIATATASLTATGPNDAWQHAQLASLLHDIVHEAGVAGARETGTGVAGSAGRDTAARLELAEVRALLADRLRGRPTRANFRTGHLTMCTLVPMRSVPHRVVCLLGLDDGAFPRVTAPEGDDIVKRAPRVGDHDPRSEDRQLLLDALLSATGHLVITYTGRDERTNVVRPPAVPLGELLEVIDSTVRSAENSGSGGPDRSARAQVVVDHPLQPFDARNFAPGALVPGSPWSFDPVSLDGAHAARSERIAIPPFLEGPLPPRLDGLIEVDELVRFVQHPTRAFLRQRLGISLREGDDDPSDAITVELDHLQQWDIGRRLLETRLTGIDADACRAAEFARGLLPPGVLGERLVDRILPAVEGIAAAALTLGDPDADIGSAEVNIDLGGGRSLVGTVPDLVGDVARTVIYSRVGPKHRLAAWVRLLALSAAHPERPFRAVTIGRGPGTRVARAELGPLGRDPETRHLLATDLLRRLVDLYDRGLVEPLPVYAKTSAAYAEACATGLDARSRTAAAAKARKEWESSYKWDNEDREPEHRLVRDGVAAWDDVLGVLAGPDESGEGWAADEPTRFGRLSLRLWEGLLAAEKVTIT